MMPAEIPKTSPSYGAAIGVTPPTEKTEHHDTHATHHLKDKLANVADVNTTAGFLEVQDDEELRATKSTRQDAAGMRRMGKEQQLVRNFVNCRWTRSSQPQSQVVKLHSRYQKMKQSLANASCSGMGARYLCHIAWPD